MWDNTQLVHRVRMLKNVQKDKKIRKKGFLAFFVIDPQNQLEHTTKNTSLKREDLLGVLHEVLGHMDVCELIAEFASLGVTLEEAKRRRREYIAVKKHTKGKFGEISFGNCGQMYYFPHAKAMNFVVRENPRGDGGPFEIFGNQSDMRTATETQSNVDVDNPPHKQVLHLGNCYRKK